MELEDSKTTCYLGISCSAHDPSIAIISAEGKLIFAEATERSLQFKRALNSVPDYYPFISKLLKKYADNSTHLIIAKNWSRTHQRKVKAGYLALSVFRPLLRRIPFFWLVIDRYLFMLSLQAHAFIFCGQNLIREWRDSHNHFFNFVLKYKRSWIDKNISDPVVDEKRKKIRERYYDHHLCHAASAAYASPFLEADVAVIDGYGEMSSTAFYHFKGGKLHELHRIRKSKNSLGFYYSSLCAACGFNPDLGEEWKVMGLAAYGKVIPELYEALEKLIPIKNGAFCKPNALFDIALFDQLMWKHSRQIEAQDIACTGQKVFEDKMFECLNYFYSFSDCKNLVLVGGCALNSSCNGKIKSKTPYENIYVYNAPGDDGTSVGAAILAYLEGDNPPIDRNSLATPFTGSSISTKDLAKLANNNPFCFDLGERKCYVAASLIAKGNIIGWVQGPAEFGPRALGARSILADPRNRDIQDIINKTIKYRDEFRPFAPSVLDEYGDQYFEEYQPSRYMDKTLIVRPEYRDVIPGITHVNGTGRVQSVERSTHPVYYELISEFHRLTGVPVVLNTSFNLSGKPIVDSIYDIIAALYSTGLHAVIIENYLFTKQPFDIETE